MKKINEQERKELEIYGKVGSMLILCEIKAQ